MLRSFIRRTAVPRFAAPRLSTPVTPLRTPSPLFNAARGFSSKPEGARAQTSSAAGNGIRTTNEDFKGRYMLIYFGFTNCPDICPEELDKMAEVLDTVKADPQIGDVITPIFITCDPQRDTVAEVNEYVKDFHKDLIGLTGSLEEIARVAKSYRVYFSKPPKVNPGEDYLVDHSIFFYLMAPDGSFVDCYAKDHTAEFVSQSVKDHIAKFKEEGGQVLPKLSEKRLSESSASASA
ncbi:Cu-binding protein [Linnemannia elongata]|nr:Cu-binding protein [Linnemannia elongata]